MTTFNNPLISSSDTLSLQIYGAVSTTKDAKPYVVAGRPLRVRDFDYSVPKPTESLLEKTLDLFSDALADPLPPEHFHAIQSAPREDEEDRRVVEQMRGKQTETLKE